jgi:hypothetical protein
MGTFQITGTPKRTIQADPRGQSKIEAEKGETIVTNTGLDGLIEHFTIGGEKHSKGGTPLDVPDGSFVFSMKKTLKIEDPQMLEFFNKNPKKPLMPGEIAKQYDVNAIKMKIKDPNIDSITKESLMLTYKNMIVKLSALAVVQESLKGTPQGHSKMFDAFTERTGLEPAALLGVTAQNKQTAEAGAAPVMAFGGGVNRRALPKFDNLAKVDGTKPYPVVGSGVNNTPNEGRPPYEEWEAYTPKGAKQLNAYLKIYGIPLVNESKPNRKEMEDAVNRMQIQMINKNPELVFDYMTKNADGSHQPNNKLETLIPQGYTKDKAGLTKALADGKLDKQTILNGYNDQKWWYRAVTAEKQYMDKAKYDAFIKENPNGIPQGEYVYFLDEKDPENYIAYYTDKNGNPTTVVPDAKKIDEPMKIDAQTLGQGIQQQQNMDFYIQDKNNLKNIARKRSRLKKYEDFSPNPELGFVDQAYYSPEQAIHAIGSQLATGVDGQTAFMTPQSQTANFTQMQGNAFAQVAQEIGKYADLNVNAYNQERMLNTEIANKKAMLSAENAHSSQASRINNEKSWTRDLNALDDMLTSGINKAISHRADRLNMERSIGEQYKIDPNTGIAYYDKGKAVTPTNGTEKDMADEINEMMSKVAGLSATDATRAVLAQRSGKYVLDASASDNVTMPSELGQ